MPLFLLTVNQRRASNNIVLEKGMTVEISCRDSDLFANRSPFILEAFKNKYGLDLTKIGGVGNIRQYLNVEKIG